MNSPAIEGWDPVCLARLVSLSTLANNLGSIGHLGIFSLQVTLVLFIEQLLILQQKLVEILDSGVAPVARHEPTLLALRYRWSFTCTIVN